MGRKKKETDPDAVLQALMAEADPTILARFTGQSSVDSPEALLSRLTGSSPTAPATDEVSIPEPVEVPEIPPEPEISVADSSHAEPQADQEPAPEPIPEESVATEPLRADGLTVPGVDLWGDLDESSPPLRAAPSLDVDDDGEG